MWKKLVVLVACVGGVLPLQAQAQARVKAECVTLEIRTPSEYALDSITLVLDAVYPGKRGLARLTVEDVASCNQLVVRTTERSTSGYQTYGASADGFVEGAASPASNPVLIALRLLVKNKLARVKVPKGTVGRVLTNVCDRDEGTLTVYDAGWKKDRMRADLDASPGETTDKEYDEPDGRCRHYVRKPV